MTAASKLLCAGRTPLWLALSLSLSVLGCEGGDAGETGGAAGDRSLGQAGASGTGFGGAWSGELTPALETEVVGTSGKPFVPEGIELAYVGEAPSPGLEIVTFTLHQSYGLLGKVVWHLAVKNNGTDVICLLNLPYSFYDASGALLVEDTFPQDVETPMWAKGGEPEACLGPGQVGMAEYDYGLDGLAVDEVARIDYSFIGIVDNTVQPLEGIELRNLQVTQPYQSYSLSGELYNGWTATIEAPSVNVFLVDPLGRPTAELFDISLEQVASGGSWQFEASFSDAPPENYVVFYDFHEVFDF